MTTVQHKAFETAKNNIIDSKYQFAKEIKVDDISGVLQVMITVAFKNCKSKLVQSMTERTFMFFIGKRGGYYVYNKGESVTKKYLPLHALVTESLI